MSRARRTLADRIEQLRGDAPVTSPVPGALVVAAGVLVLVIAITGRVPLLGAEHGRLVHAEFATVNQVNDRTPVRVAGVEVGRVQSVQAGSTPGTAEVTMRIVNDDVAIRRDARADIRWRTLLGGNMYVDLQPGSPSAPLLGDHAIPRGRTSSQVELDDVTDIFSGGTAQAQRVMLRELRHGLSDPGSTGRAIDTLGPALRTVARGMQPLRGREADDLRRMIAAAGRTVAGLGRDPGDLQRLVDGADRTLAVTDARREQLRELLELAPGSLASTRSTMARLRVTLQHVDPLVARLRVAAPAIAPAAEAATPTLRRLRALLRDARPLLRGAAPTLAAARRAGLSGVPLLAALDPTVRRLNARLLPFLDRRDAGTRLRNYEAIGPWFAAVDSFGAEFNDAGHIVQFPVLPGPNSAIPLSGAPGSSSGLTRACRREVPASRRDRCPQAAGLLKQMFGGKR